MDNAAAHAILCGMDGHNRIDALIVGGGLVGGALALALSREGFDIALVDDRPEGPDLGGRAYALSLTSVRLLRAIGLWDALAADAEPILAVRVGDGREGERPSGLTLGLDHAELGEGPLGHMVEEARLRPALDAALSGVEVLRPARVVAQATDGARARVTLADGSARQAALLVAADGRESGTARRAGIARTRATYGQAALTCVLGHERPHGGVAHQVFLPGGPLAVLPLPRGRSSLVWSLPAARATALAALPEAEFLAALRPVLGDFLGRVTRETAPQVYPLGLSLAQRFAAPRLALVGDAARAVHPVAGQGLNAGLRDVAALADVLAEARSRGEDVGAPDVLERYARWRRFDSAALAAGTDAVVRLFSTDAGPVRAARDLGMAALARVPSLRRFAMREAAGLTGDLPRLMR